MKTKQLLIFLLCLLLIMPNALYGSSTSPPTDKVVYLTFDDGPTPKITEHILDVLKQEGIKATFFIVGKEIKGRESILKRIYEEGHGIGLHTYSHNFKEIYRSPEAFISEMDQAATAINEALGLELNIKVLRFPGGSAGRLNKTFFSALEAKGYKIFDWNVDLQDGVKASLSPGEFLNNAKKFRDKSTRKFILAHCNSNNQNTCNALSDIIHFYKDEGYHFEIITNDTEPYYYKFKK